MKRNVLTCLAAVTILATLACVDPALRAQKINRENLFSLQIGKMEDQIDLFQTDPQEYQNKTRISMRDGLFYISNGNSGKISKFSSYGDLLSMVYNQEKNPAPVLLKPAETEVSNTVRKAWSHPLNNPGEIVVSSNQQMFVEDKLPAERIVRDEATGNLLDNVILRFSASGEYIDFLGQEGIGGTPFPYISGLYCTALKEIVIISMTQTNWMVFWFAESGNLLYSIKINRDALPQTGKTPVIASVDRIVPDMEEHTLYFKVDYFRESTDTQANTPSGIAYVSSLVWLMDPATGAFHGNFPVPSIEKTEEDASGKRKYPRIYEFMGTARGRNLFFMMPDDNGQYIVMIMNAGNKTTKRAYISVENDEMFYNSFFLSESGILSALFSTQYEAKVAWWRLDRLLGDARQ